jgi:hypothetical protein
MDILNQKLIKMPNAARKHTTPDMSLSNQLSSIKHVFKIELDIINLNLLMYGSLII